MTKPEFSWHLAEHRDPYVDWEFYEGKTRDINRPWWWSRCIHRDHEYYTLELDPDQRGKEHGCWRVVMEVEHVAVLHLTCQGTIHIVVDIPNVGAVCKTLGVVEYGEWSEQQLMEYVQGKVRELRSIRAMY